MDEIEKIIPPKLPKGMAISNGKRIARFKRECCGVNEELLGPIQPERSKREDSLINVHAFKPTCFCESCNEFVEQKIRDAVL